MIRNVEATGGDYADYLDQARIGRSGRSEKELATRGVIINYEVTMAGYRNKRLPLKWSLIDAKTKANVVDPALTNQLALTITPDACSFHVGHPIWVHPPAGQLYYVQLYLYDDNAIQLDAAGSPSFSLARP